MPHMTAIKPALIRFGLGPYLEEVPGWETRGSASFAPACSIGHHTAGPLSGDRPSLNICVNGRADLPGPLCNDFLSRSKVILVAAGRPNHAGTGGFRGLVGNSAAFGNEAESNGIGRKDGSPDWSEFQQWAFPRVHAAHLYVLGRDSSWYLGHRDWTSRKIDPTDIDTANMRREISAVMANPEDDMQLTDPIESRINSDIDPKTGRGKTVTVKDVLQNIQWNADETRKLAERSVTQNGELTAAVINGLLDAPIDRTELGRGPTTLRSILTWSDNHVDALASGIAAAASAGEATPAEVRRLVADAVNSLNVTLTAS